MTLSELLDMSGTEIIELCNNISKHYYQFQIPKRNGTFRLIKAPDSILKEIQRKLLYNLFYKFKPHEIAHGFVKNRNPKTNAEVHKNAGVLLTLDVEDFFSSIKIDDITRLLKKLYAAHPELFEGFEKYSIRKFNGIITNMAKLVTLNTELPQGSPCSPVLANLYCYTFDGELQKLAKEYNCIVTRYADDITLSHVDPRFDIGQLIKPIARLAGKYHLRLNREKTRILRPHRRMEVTGVVINSGHNAPKHYRKLVRAKIHNKIEKDIQIDEEKLRGEVEWIRYLNPKHAQPLMEKLGWKNHKKSNESSNHTPKLTNSE